MELRRRCDALRPGSPLRLIGKEDAHSPDDPPLKLHADSAPLVDGETNGSPQEREWKAAAQPLDRLVRARHEGLDRGDMLAVWLAICPAQH